VEQLQEVIVKTEDDLRAEFNASLRQVMAEYDATIQERFQALRGLVIGKPQTWLRAYLGPLLVALGIVLGTIARSLHTDRNGAATILSQTQDRLANRIATVTTATDKDCRPVVAAAITARARPTRPRW
jgi:hypothetical protein